MSVATSCRRPPNCSVRVCAQIGALRFWLMIILRLPFRSFVREQMEMCQALCVHRSVDAAPAQPIVIQRDRGEPLAGRRWPRQRTGEACERVAHAAWVGLAEVRARPDSPV